MIVIRTSTPEEAVSVWLKAELDSPRFKDQLLENLNKSGSGVDLITNPDLDSKNDNERRAMLLKSYRSWLDINFSDFEWKLVKLNKTDVGELHYIDYDYWNELSDNTHLVKVAADNVTKGVSVFDVDNEPFFLVADKMDRLQELEPVIILNEEAHLKIIEGHVRATAFMLAKKLRKLEALMGILKE